MELRQSEVSVHFHDRLQLSNGGIVLAVKVQHPAEDLPHPKRRRFDVHCLTRFGDSLLETTLCDQVGRV
jgi:hypothetical protein